ncbi:MAG: 23S rRNA (uracil(1939)-C(5))-methyltransferase RlmD [Burkholderiales bacterium]|nr:23S rRNA (uracil(1939)-C(5))-methyltransferase RlmD [Burkholderiales bacterium]
MSESVGEPIWVESLDLDAQGIARLPPAIGAPASEAGKVLFIRGALPTELVSYQITRDKARFAKAKVIQILKPAVFRTKPRCAAFGICGGCSMQHLDVAAQIAIKQRVLEDDLWHLARTKSAEILRPLDGPNWAYRQRARLSVVNRSIKKGTALVGFHEFNSGYVADMLACEILPQSVSTLLHPLRDLVNALSIPDDIAQFELAVGEGNATNSFQAVTVLVMRHMAPLSPADLDLVRSFAEQRLVWIWLQPGGIDTAKPFHPMAGSLAYHLPEFALEIHFLPTDFTQVNHAMNRALVGQAMRLLAPQANERILDLFCGIGNFTLPLARLAKAVLGIDGNNALMLRAHSNAKHNGLSDIAQFQLANLFTADAEMVRSWGPIDRWLIDPPREGAMALCQALAVLHQNLLAGDATANAFLPQRIVYVSCNPKTLARDTAILLGDAGYELTKAGIVNMFPHTSHIESMAVFEKK